MPAIQTTYGQRLAPAYEGMIANSEDHVIKTMICESAAGIGFGKVAVQGTNDDQCRVSEAARAFRGLTEASHTSAHGLEDRYLQYEEVPVMIKGVMWVSASVAVAVGQPVHYIAATGVLSNTGGVVIEGAIWESSTAGAGLAKVRLG